MANPTTASWTDPTTNTDGSTITAGEITGYEVGVRLASGTAGTYTSTATVAASATSCPLSALTPAIGFGSFMAAVRTLSTTNGDSAYTAEVAFSLVAPTPNPPSGFSVA